eukprot:14118768-Ditylum_brightwellii.AAC.1
MEYKIRLTPTKEKFYTQTKELNEISFLATEAGLVGSTTGDSFDCISQLKVMNYQEAMSTDKPDEWDESVIKEHETFMKYKVWKAVPRSK